MRHLPRITWIIAVAALASACQDIEPEDELERDTVLELDTADVEQEEEQPPADTTTISFSLALTRDSVIADSVVRVAPGNVVRFEGDPGSVWVVAFADSVPFQQGRRVYYGGHTPAEALTRRVVADTGNVYKYSIFYPIGDGGRYGVLDPKLVVFEEPGMSADTASAEPN